MKKILFVYVIALLPLFSIAQRSSIEEIFNKYSGQDGYTSVLITEYMFNLFAKIANESEDKEFKEITSQLKSIRILTADEPVGTKQNRSFYEEVLAALPKSLYKDLMIVKDGDEEIKFLIREEGQKISEFVMVIGGGEEAVLISLHGDIDLETISKLSNSMNIQGLEHLEKVDSLDKQ